jgi:putative RNA 2'-phosphotransferase
MSETEITEAGLIAMSRFLSKVLRHEPELVGVRLDDGGWVGVQELLDGIDRAARNRNAPKRLRTLPKVTLEAIRIVVANNPKQRFALSADGARIRAVQGHSVEVELGYTPKEPPPVLFHGTSFANTASIFKQGLHRGARHAVHLSRDAATARVVGSRHGKPIVLEVAAARMHKDGFKFTEADNGTWLVESVPPQYLRRLG